MQEKFATLNAAWLVVVDGKVIASGKSLKNKPMPPQLLKICRRTGKFPFVFVNDKLIAIEECVSAWHDTIQLGEGSTHLLRAERFGQWIGLDNLKTKSATPSSSNPSPTAR